MLELMARFGAASLVIGAGAGVHDPIAAACFLGGGVFSCLVVLVGHLIRQAQDLQPLPTWSEGFRLLWSGQSIAGLRFTLCYTAVAVIAVTATQALGLQRGFWVTITALLVMRPLPRLGSLLHRIANELSSDICARAWVWPAVCPLHPCPARVRST
jgi:uncharacterized membrane protein YccC